MVRRTKEEAQRMIKSIAILLRNTTWKCGRVEKLIVNHLQNQIRKFGSPRIPVKEMLQHLKLSGKQKSEFLDAIKRLEKRRIIRIEGFA
jgi:transcription initiation factor TFIIIB Brf1 subunit/transcription initiation factor TFIIB